MQEKEEMTNHTQTVLIPLPRQNVPVTRRHRGGERGRKTDNRMNVEINSILSFFD